MRLNTMKTKNPSRSSQVYDYYMSYCGFEIFRSISAEGYVSYRWSGGDTILFALEYVIEQLDILILKRQGLWPDEPSITPEI